MIGIIEPAGDDELTAYKEWASKPPLLKGNEWGDTVVLCLIARVRQEQAAIADLRDIIEELMAYHGDPLPTYEARWNAAMERARKALGDK